MGKKRTNDGREKTANVTSNKASDPAPLNDTPPGAQAPNSSSAPSPTEAIPASARNVKKQKLEKLQDAPAGPKQPGQTTSQRQNRNKLPKLPPNAAITKRPLHHSAIPTLFASSDHPKTLYISHATPFIPTLKRIRRLLLEISNRQGQSQAAQFAQNRQSRPLRKPLIPNGRLAPGHVEREVAEEGGNEGGGVSGEEVYVKATGRAIERALRVGVHFQGESDCRVSVKTGSVMAVDDIEIRYDAEDEGGEGSNRRKFELNEEDVPETRIRMVSSITVAIGFR